MECGISRYKPRKELYKLVSTSNLKLITTNLAKIENVLLNSLEHLIYEWLA
jgi:hypothetical protein